MIIYDYDLFSNVVMFVFGELHFVFKYELQNQAQDVIENRMS